MNKEHFLLTLKIYLRPLEAADLKQILDEYQEKFKTGESEGKTPEQISQELGDPKQLARQILKEKGLDPIDPAEHLKKQGWQSIEDQQDHVQSYDQYYAPDQKPNHFNIWKALWALALTFLLMLWVFISIGGVFIGLYIATFVTFLSPLLGIGLFVLQVPTVSLLAIFISILLSGLALLGIMILNPLCKLFYQIVRAYSLWVVNAVTGGQYR